MALDAVVIGSGPNGLTAGALLARAGLAVRVVEARDTPGGGARSGFATLPGYVHDHCSSVHPLGVLSPVFRALELDRHGLEWIEAPSQLIHLLPGGRGVSLERSIADTAAQLGPDGDRYRRLLEPFVERADDLLPMLLGPLRFPARPWLMARFGLKALQSMRGLACRFEDDAAGALLGGIAAHAMLPLGDLATASFGLVLAIAGHAGGWPLARGGSQAITSALLASLEEKGGVLQLDHEVRSLADLPPARAYVFDVTPRQLIAIAGERLPARYRARLGRYRYGPGVFKLDWALSSPIPWKDGRCARAPTVHLSGTLTDIDRAESLVHDGELGERPFILLVQPTLFDPGRAPRGGHIAWAYCHTPHGSTVDARAAIEAHIEEFAPGFRECIVACRSMNAQEMEAYNPNYVGGDINGGVADLGQLFFRPVARRDPYSTPAADLFLCSSSTPPGGGVHGLCGYFAAESVLRRLGQ